LSLGKGSCDLEEAELLREVHLHFGELRGRIDRILATALDRTKPLETRGRAVAWLRTVSELARALEKTNRR
jgi:hypothetical protein